MLDGLKMEENFQSAIETSASFSSLLGKCSTPFVAMRSPAARLGAEDVSSPGTGLGDQASTLFVHVAAPTLCHSVSISPFEPSLS